MLSLGTRFHWLSTFASFTMKKPAKFYIPILHRILGLFIGLMPDDIKRIVFNSSLCRLLSSTHSVNEQELELLNEQMSLASNTQAMILPAMCADVIWHDVKEELMELSKSKDSGPGTAAIACKIREKTSPWLLYDKFSSMEADVKQVLRVTGA